MKKEQRFIITEIYSQDLHAVNKVLVDTKTRVQYLMHQEGASCGIVCIVDETGKPLLSDNLQPIEFTKDQCIEDKDTIKSRWMNEKLEELPPVEIK